MKISHLWCAMLLGGLGGLISVAGCTVSNDPGDLGAATEEYRRRPRRDAGAPIPPPPSDPRTPGPMTPPPDFTGTGCEVCERAQMCCKTVNPTGNCTFNAVTCETYSPNQQYYYGGCRVFLRTVWSAWGGAPPVSCQL